LTTVVILVQPVCRWESLISPGRAVSQTQRSSGVGAALYLSCPDARHKSGESSMLVDPGHGQRSRSDWLGGCKERM